MQKLIAVFCLSDGSSIDSNPGLCLELEKLQHGILLTEQVVLFLGEQDTNSHKANFERHLGELDEVLVFRVERGAWKLSAERQKWLLDFLSSDQ